jgi:hypothetical protein
VPLAFQVGLICEEFGCTPSIALRELEDGPNGWVWEVIEARRYAKVRAEIEAAKDPEHAPTGELADLYWELKGEDWQARRSGRGENEGDDEDDDQRQDAPHHEPD